MPTSDVRVWNGASWDSLKGPQGDPGPQAVSSDVGNLLKLGADNKVLFKGELPLASLAQGNTYLQNDATGTKVWKHPLNGNVWPAANGQNGQLLATDASGNLSWVTPSLPRSGIWAPAQADGYPMDWQTGSITYGNWTRIGNVVNLNFTGYTLTNPDDIGVNGVGVGGLPFPVRQFNNRFHYGSLLGYFPLGVVGPSLTWIPKPLGFALCGHLYPADRIILFWKWDEWPTDWPKDKCRFSMYITYITDAP